MRIDSGYPRASATSAVNYPNLAALKTWDGGLVAGFEHADEVEFGEAAAGEPEAGGGG